MDLTKEEQQRQEFQSILNPCLKMRIRIYASMD